MSINRFFNGEFARSALEFIRSQNQKNIITPEDRLKKLVERYKDVKLLNCPFCGGVSELKFFLHVYDGHSGMPGAYHITVNPICTCCGARFDEQSVFTNVTAPGEGIMSEEKVDKYITEHIKKWNRRCN